MIPEVDTAHVYTGVVECVLALSQLLFGIYCLQQSTPERKRIVAWNTIGIASLVILHFIAFLTAPWEAVVVIRTLMVTALFSGIMYCVLLVSNAQYAVANMTLRPPIWGPRILLAGFVLVAIAQIISSVGTLVTDRVIWTLFLMIAVLLGAIFTGAFFVYSLYRLRLGLRRAIQSREANSVYINVTPADTKSADKNTQKGSNVNSRDSPAAVNFSKNEIRQTTTKLVTVSESRMLNKMSCMMLLSIIVVIMASVWSAMRAAELLRSRTALNDRFSDFLANARRMWSVRERMPIWVAICINGIELYFTWR
mmetsp:Transcript_6258/g.12475  ORF Transcript_6258/g.12475 Transcript_6258/m.12475 type:complete len:309 (-) Transcript_6258:172-1098(-)